MEEKKGFSLSVENADGPIQLTLMNNTTGTGLRLLGAKGSPTVNELKQFLEGAE